MRYSDFDQREMDIKSGEEMDRRANARCLICGKARQGNAPSCEHSILEQDSWREKLRHKRLEDHDCAVARGEAEPL